MVSVTEPGSDIDDRLAALILKRQESILAKNPISIHELCRDCPELQSKLEQALSQLDTLHSVLLPHSNRTGLVMSSSQTIAHESEDSDDSSDRSLPEVPGYEVIEEIGRGGMGVVFKARQISLNRIVAIKALTGRRWGRKEFVARLRHEATALSKIVHPGVVKVIDVVETSSSVSMILEFIDGESLSSRLDRSALPPEQAAAIALELARTLVVVHQHGLLHRDIKPANVLLDRSGATKLADFGLVKEEGCASEITQAGEVFGTPSYMAPEQAASQFELVDVRTDIYAVGATLYEMLSGRPPFVGVSLFDTLQKVQHSELVGLRVINHAVPRDLETICHKCLEKRNSDRFSNAQELVAELERFQQGLPIQSRSISPFERGRRWCRRRPVVSGLAALLFSSAIAICGLLVSNNRNLRRFNQELTRLNEDSERLNLSLKKSNEELDRVAADAKNHQRIAEVHERQAKDALYIADMNRAAIALGQDDPREAASLLEKHVPAPGELDRRGFVWWALHRQTNRLRRILLETGSSQYFLCFSRDRQLLAAAGLDSVVRLIDPETGELRKQIATEQVEVNGVAFSPDGKEMATAGDDGTICVWNLESERMRLRFKAQPGKAFQLVYTHDGSQIISCGDNPVIRVFDSLTGTESHKLEGHLRKDIQCLLIADDGKTLFSTGNDHHVRRWDLKLRKEVGSFESSNDIVPVVFDASRDLLVVGDGSGEVHTISAKTFKKISSVKHLDRIHSLALDLTGTLLAVGDGSGQIRLWRLNKAGQFVTSADHAWLAHEKGAQALIWSRDGSRLISTGNDGRVISWSLDDLQALGRIDVDMETTSEFCLIPKSTSMLIRASDNRLAIWDWKRASTNYITDPGVYFDPAISSNKTSFACLLNHRSVDNTKSEDSVLLYPFPLDSQHGPVMKAVAEWAPKGELQNIRFSPDSRALAVSRWHREVGQDVEDHTVWLVPIPDSVSHAGDRAEAIKIQDAERIPVLFAKGCAFSPDGRCLTLITRTGVVQWDIADRRIVWEVPRTTIHHVDYSSDGTLIATGGHDRMVYVVRSVDGSTRFSLGTHRALIRSISFAPGGRLLASASSDGAVKLWHVESGQELAEFQNAGKDIRKLQFTDDGNFLICQFRDNKLDKRDRIRIIDGSHR